MPHILRFSSASFTFVMLAMLCACGPRASSVKGNTEGYDLDHPKVIAMPTVLSELSGLWYYAKDGSLFAIEDEDGYLYKIFPSKPDSIQRWRFAGHGDFEDLCVVNGIFYILRSDGKIFETAIPSGDNINVNKYEVPETGDEFESLYWDAARGLIILVCKDCTDDKRKTLGTWGFNPVTKQFVPSPFEIYAKDIARLIGQEKIKFKPSAAAINPATGQLWLLSSVNKLLVTADTGGNIIQAYPLDPKIYKQPEGIAFGSDRTLYISNERGERGSFGPANILVIPYRPASKK